MIKPSIKTHIKLGGKEWVARCIGISGEKIQEMGKDIADTAQKNVAVLSMSFLETTGALESEINYEQTGKMSCKISATSGHSSFIEWGTQFIEKGMPYLWPAYRTVKKAFFKGGPWV